MTAWLLDFLSNLAAGLVGGAILGAVGAALAARRSQRGGAGGSPATPSAPVRVEVTVNSVQAAASGPERRRTEWSPSTGTSDNEQLVLFAILALAGVVLITYGYFRFQETILLGVTAVSALVLSTITVFLVLVGRRSVHVVGMLTVHVASSLAAAVVVVVDLYLLLRASQRPDQQRLALDARGDLAGFVSRHSLLELVAVLYQLLGFVMALLVLVMCLWAASGLLARVATGLAMVQRRTPTRLTRWLSATGPHGWRYVVVAIGLATLSLLLTTGTVFGWIERTLPDTPPVAQATQLTTSANKGGRRVRFCGHLVSNGQDVAGRPLVLQLRRAGGWTASGEARTTDSTGRSCADLARSDSRRTWRWTFAGDASYAASTSEGRKI